MTAAMFKHLPKATLSKQIARLNMIAGNPENAFRFPDLIAKIELVLIQNSVHGPSIGLKKFWRYNLPTLKFHNEAVEFAMTRVKTKTKEDLQKVPTKIIAYGKNKELIEVDCANKVPLQILDQLVKKTNATPLTWNEIPVIKMPKVQ